MTRRERLMATLMGKPVDRPAVNFYELGGFDINPDDPDPYNVYNAPDWRPLLALTEQHTDMIRMIHAARPRTASMEKMARRAEVIAEYVVDDGLARTTTTVMTIAGRTLRQVTVRERDVNTTWTTEHLLKSVDDVNAYLQIPDECFEETVDVEPLQQAEAALGDKGIVMVDTEDPLCAAAVLFSMEDYMTLAFTEPVLFGKLLEKMARRIQRRTEDVSRLFPGRLWRIYGPEYAAEPYLSPALFRDYVVEYVRPMAQAIRRHGGFVRIHSHGRLRGILPLIEEIGVDALDPVEPPPQGDMALREVRHRYGRQWVLFGNLEISDIENMPTPQFAERVKQALEAGQSGEGRGFVLMPSAAPYGRAISPLCLRNYESMVGLATR